MTAPGGFDRDEALGRLGADQFDVVVVGGGITGAGVALDAAARGLRTALVEARDFASGTSSRSSKLVHGGLRYLQQREYRLVRENLVERGRLLTNAPHLVRPLPFVIPLLAGGPGGGRAAARAYSTALWSYDLVGGAGIGTRHRRISAEGVLAHLPALRPDRVVGGFVYHDAHADDARLTLAVARTAALDHGAAVANYSPVAGLAKDRSGRVRGVCLADGTEVRTASVVNAAGVWADEVRALDEADRPPSLRPAKGVHVTLRPGALPCSAAAVLPVPGDRRSVFVVPWAGRVYVGTTDTDYDGPLDDPRCTPADLAYVLDALNAVVANPVSRSDVVATWAGLRPLVAGREAGRTADLSRRHRVTTSASGIVTVTGGKLTTYRRMAADAVDEVVRLVGRGGRRSPTADLPIRGAAGRGAVAERPGVDREVLDHLTGRYGDEARAVLRLVADDADLGRPLVAGLPYLRAEAVHAARSEMARTLDDVLGRRTRALALDVEASMAAAGDVARLLAGELGWSRQRVDEEATACAAAARREREAARLPARPADAVPRHDQVSAAGEAGSPDGQVTDRARGPARWR